MVVVRLRIFRLWTSFPPPSFLFFFFGGGGGGEVCVGVGVGRSVGGWGGG